MRTLWLAFLLTVGAASSWAQHIPGNSWAWWASPVVRDLNLSPEQLRQVRATVREYRMQLIDLRGNVQKAELEVEDAFNEEHFQPQRASAAVERLIAARTELGKALGQLSLKLRGAITADQWRELQRRRPRLADR